MSKQIQKISLAVLVAGAMIFAVMKIREYTVLIGTPAKTTPALDPLRIDLSNMVLRYKNDGLTIIDISTITTFSWDQFYIFGPYTEPAELDSMVGRSWRDNCVTQIETSDSYTLLVFTKNDVVVHCLDYPRGENYFFIPTKGYESGFSPQEAHFILDEQGRIILVGDN